ncbi:MAG: hypothetical protein A3H36_03135 [Chloroflexi bacterium RIFCSPLOWO2_02_FULL_71_16]|nr:MAG: hypothetical protein A3H36_03135 [Chloroflexi bacterium RIFCSPLOWO2_02_FULL_71_16]
MPRGPDDAERRRRRVGHGETTPVQEPNAAGTTTRASTSMTAIHRPSAMPVATGGSEGRSVPPERCGRCSGDRRRPGGGSSGGEAPR